MKNTQVTFWLLFAFSLLPLVAAAEGGTRHGDAIVPMLIIHGTNDPCVPVAEAERLFASLKTNGAKPWLMIAKDEGHGFQKQENIIRLDEAMTLFLQ